jgi:F-type H+-transporting ATPase subunit delta
LIRTRIANRYARALFELAQEADRIAAAALQPLVVNFLRTLLEARKLPFLGDMVAAYGRMVDEATGRVRGEALTPMPLADSDLEALTSALSRATEKEVILEARTDPSLLGGVLARVGNLVFDGSIRSQLQRMRETLIKG